MTEQPVAEVQRPVADLSNRPLYRRIDEMVAWVSARSGLHRGDIISRYRTGELARARFAIMWAARRATRLSLPQIGRHLGGRDHTTIRSGIRSADELREVHPPFRALTDELLAAFTLSSAKEFEQ